MENDTISSVSPHKKHKKHKKKDVKQKAVFEEASEKKTSGIKLKIKLGGQTLCTTKRAKKQPYDVVSSKKSKGHISDEEREFLDAVERGDASVLGPKKPKLLTARQRAIRDLKEQPEIAQPTLGGPPLTARPQLSAQEILQKELKSKERREKDRKKEDKAKRETLQRLTARQEDGRKRRWKKEVLVEEIEGRETPPSFSRNLSSASLFAEQSGDDDVDSQPPTVADIEEPKPRPTEPVGPTIRYIISSRSGFSISLPDGLEFPLKPSVATASSLDRKKGCIPCCVEGCSNWRKYTCSKTGRPVCSLACYKLNILAAPSENIVGTRARDIPSDTQDTVSSQSSDIMSSDNAYTTRSRTSTVEDADTIPSSAKQVSPERKQSVLDKTVTETGKTTGSVADNENRADTLESHTTDQDRSRGSSEANEVLPQMAVTHAKEANMPTEDSPSNGELEPGLVIDEQLSRDSEDVDKSTEC